MNRQIALDTPATLFTRTDTDLPGEAPIRSHEFQTLGEAVRYAVEELGDEVTYFYISGATDRLDADQIRSIYDSEKLGTAGSA